MTSFDPNLWYQITSPIFDSRSLVGQRHRGSSGQAPVFFKSTVEAGNGRLWQLFPTDNDTFVLRTFASSPDTYLALRPNNESTATPKESEAIMRNVNSASDEVFWKINSFANGGYNLENAANGSAWHLRANDADNLVMTNNIAEQDNQRFEFASAGSINDLAFSSIKLPSGATATVPAQSGPTQSPTETPAQDGSQEQSSSSGLSTGSKIGIGFGVAGGVLLIVAALIYIWFLRSRKRDRLAKAANGPDPELDGSQTYYGAPPRPAGGHSDTQKYAMRELSGDTTIQELDGTEQTHGRKP